MPSNPKLEACSTASLDLHNEAVADLTAMRAIMDAAKVLTALERAEAEGKEGALDTGQGYAAGYVLCDSTLPDLLHHGTSLVDSLERKVEQMARAGREQLREVANG